MPISRRVLDDGEHVVLDVRPHWSMLTAPLLCSAGVVAGAITVVSMFPSAPLPADWALAAVVATCLAWLGLRGVRWLATSLVVTTTRVVLRRGVLVRDMAQIRLVRIAEVHVRQTLFQRALGTGRVVIEVPGDDALAIDDVRQPRAFQRVLNHQLDLAGSAADAGSPGGAWSAPAAATGPTLGGAMATTPPHGLVVNAGGTSGSGITEQLIALDELRRRGIVTPLEFEAKKAELLSRL